jgi:glycine/D-amino acid oxidase-like deaminating enzyme
MKRKEVHVVIGAGIAGCLSAITRTRAGYEVVLLEKEQARSPGTYPLCTQTSNIVSENHSGAEYPFDPRSARDCLDGRIVNQQFFPELIYGGKTYTYVIASQSMVDNGYDIVAQCRANMEVIRSHYMRRCAEDPSNAVFGGPGAICRELSTVKGVNDVAVVFITPQRGVNPVLVSTILEWEIKRNGIDFREGSTVTSVAERRDGRYQVEFAGAGGTRESLVADQVSLCSGATAFRMARRLSPSFEFPEIFMALREILYVDLPDGTDKNFTCLKLEDSFGGLFSPMNEHAAMIYYPPAGHIMNAVMDPASCMLPAEYPRHLADGHPEMQERAEWTLDQLRKFYPELRRSTILRTYLKVAINTVSDSRVRRNIGVFVVRPGATVTVLPKWTMCAVNARKELALALEHSASSGNIEPREVSELLAHATKTCWEAAPTWAAEPTEVAARAARHAVNMNTPQMIAEIFSDPSAGAGESATWATKASRTP